MLENKIPYWILIAKNELGETEIPGEKHNPKILKYHSITTLEAKTDEISWCSSYVNWVMKEAGFDYTKSALARSWLKYGMQITQPKYGCIVVFSRGTLPWQGHVGFYISEDQYNIQLLGGNQSNKVCIKNYDKTKVLGYRWPNKPIVSWNDLNDIPYSKGEKAVIKECLRNLKTLTELAKNIHLEDLLNKITFNMNKG